MMRRDFSVYIIGVVGVKPAPTDREIFHDIPYLQAMNNPSRYGTQRMVPEGHSSILKDLGCSLHGRTYHLQHL
jgi:hypothetical protein